MYIQVTEREAAAVAELESMKKMKKNEEKK